MGHAKTHDYDGKSLTLREWADELSVSVRFITAAANQGWLIDDIAHGRVVKEPRAGKTNPRWTVEEEAIVLAWSRRGETCRAIAIEIGRSPSAVEQRLAKLERDET